MRFFLQYLFAKKLQSHTVTREKLHESLSYENRARKMLMKLTPDQLFSTYSFSPAKEYLQKS